MECGVAPGRQPGNGDLSPATLETELCRQAECLWGTDSSPEHLKLKGVIIIGTKEHR